MPQPTDRCNFMNFPTSAAATISTRLRGRNIGGNHGAVRRRPTPSRATGTYSDEVIRLLGSAYISSPSSGEIKKPTICSVAQVWVHFRARTARDEAPPRRSMLWMKPKKHGRPGMELSYTQNLEDYHLSLAFAGRKSGTYIDVGAGHPVADNVSFWFYERGCRGVVVEPQPELAPLYAQLPPPATAACRLAGRATGEIDF